MDWLTARQQQHAQRHRMHTMPTMEVMAERAAHYKQAVPAQCLLCRAGVETVEHGWRYRATEWTAWTKRQGVVDWLEERLYRGRGRGKPLKEAVYDPKSMVIWVSGTAAKEMGADH